MIDLCATPRDLPNDSLCFHVTPTTPFPLTGSTREVKEEEEEVEEDEEEADVMIQYRS